MKTYKFLLITLTGILLQLSLQAQCDPELLENYKKNASDKEVYLKSFKGFVDDNKAESYSIMLNSKKWYRFHLYHSDKYNGTGRFTIETKNAVVANVALADSSADRQIDLKCNKTEVYTLSFIKEEGDELCAEAVLTFIGKLKKGEKLEDLTSDPENDVFVIVEDMPIFTENGDLNSFRQWFAENLNYPAEAKEKGIQGKVFVQFVVDPEGYVEDVVVVRGADPILDDYAKKMIESSPKWFKPGYQRGVPVHVQFTFPVTFSL